MKSKRLVIVSITFLLMLACVVPTPNAGPADNPTGSITAGSKDFGAEATSSNSVLLTWRATAGAQKYLLDLQTDGAGFLPLVELSADQTSYEDIGVPEAFVLTYRLRAQTASGTSDGLTLTITTPEAAPNPLTVKPNDYAPITWTPPTPDPNNPNVDPSIYFPPGFDPEHPEDFDPASAMQQVQASADIGPEGGSLSVTTPDNITYELIIPPGALEETTPIALIPVQTIDGLPFDGGLRGAVRIEPDGLVLDLPATLRITRADAMPLPEGMVTLAFGFDGSGEEFHLMPFAPAGQSGWYPGAAHLASLAGAPAHAGPLAEIALQQLKEYGIGDATPKKAAAVVKNNKPTAAEARLLNDLAFGEDNPELMPLVPRQRLAADKLLSLAQSEAPDWGQITVSLAQLEILNHYYGKDPSLKDKLAKILDLLADRLSKMLQANLEKCLTGDDFYAQAVVQKILGARPGSMYDALKKKLDPQLLKDVAGMQKKCNLALTIQSKIHEDDNASAAHDVEVEGRIDNLKFNFSNGKVFLTGRGTIHYTNVKILPKKYPKTWCDPWIPDNYASVFPDVIVTRIDLTFANVPNGVLQSVKMKAMTVRDNAAFTGKATCYDIDSSGKTTKTIVKYKIPTNGGSLWYGYFIASHMSTRVLDFVVHPSDNRPLNASANAIIATYFSDQPSFNPGYGTWSETSTFELVDTGPK